MKQSISAVILTKNEKNNIEGCVTSLGWCDEIVIVDDYSDDGTLESVKCKGESVKKEIKIYQRKLNGDFAAQRNFGLEKASGDWILFMDADEVISEELEAEIKPKLLSHSGEERIDDTRIRFWTSQNDDKNVTGFYIERKDYFGGKWLKYGETANVRLLRLGRKGKGRWVGKVHEVWEMEGKTEELKNPILHYPHPSVSEFLKEVNIYTDIVVQYWKEKGREISFWEIPVYPIGKFMQNYFFRLGFLDGAAGLIMAIFMSFHSFLARSKYWMLVHLKIRNPKSEIRTKI